MHELPAVEDLIANLDEISKGKGIDRISEVCLCIGELSSYVGECVQMYFDILSEGHSCEGARLIFKHTRARFRCSSCNAEFEHGKDFTCPFCGGDGKLIPGTGKEFMIESVKT